MDNPLPPYEEIDPNIPWDELAVRFGDGSWEYIVKAETRTINGKRRIVFLFPPSDKFLETRGQGRTWESAERPGDYVMDRKTGDLYIRKHYPIEFISFPEPGHKMYNCKLTFYGHPTKESREIQALNTEIDALEGQVRNLQNQINKMQGRTGLYELTPEMIKKLKELGLIRTDQHIIGGQP